MRRPRNAARRLRRAIDSLPRRTREAMLRGIDSNRIVVGAYVDPGSGGICPMLAAHRNGGRTSVASFARAWDAYTGAGRPRAATRHEVRTLRAMLTESLDLDPELEHGSIAELAAQVRAEREQLARCAGPEPAAEPEPIPPDPDAEPAPEPVHDPAPPVETEPPAAPRAEPYLDLLAIAEAALAEQGTWARAAEREDAEPRAPAPEEPANG